MGTDVESRPNKAVQANGIGLSYVDFTSFSSLAKPTQTGDSHRAEWLLCTASGTISGTGNIRYHNKASVVPLQHFSLTFSDSSPPPNIHLKLAETRTEPNAIHTRQKTPAGKSSSRHHLRRQPAITEPHRRPDTSLEFSRPNDVIAR